MSFLEGKADFKGGQLVNERSTGIQFYSSFTHKGVKYFRYDCVYMLHVHSTDTSIGKIVKLWETPTREKKLRVVWFFRPKDVINYVKIEPRWNELFLACGEGKGLSDDIEVEKVHGKCNVICISDDKRNPQASDSAIKEADYCFSSTFNVGTRMVSKCFPDEILNVRIEAFFNRRSPDRASNMLPKQEMRSDNSGFTKNNTRVTNSGTGTLLKVSQKPKNALYKQDYAGAVNLPFNKETMMEKYGSQSVTSKNTLRHPGDARPTASVTDKPLKKRALNHSVLPDEEDTALPVQKRIKQDCTNVYLPPSSKKEYKIDATDASGTSTIKREISRGTYTVCRMDKPATGWENAGNKVIEVTKKPIVDGQIWFHDEPWQDRLQSAHEEARLVFLTNLDPSYTSSDVEDIIWSVFGAKADAKIIPCVANSTTHDGQAFVIFRKQDMADFVISELASRNLVQVDGRPIVAFRKTPLKTSNSRAFPGHLVIGDPKLKKKEAQRNAVSTSHSAQDNTIEYDFSMEWRILQEKSDLQRERLHQNQVEELKELEKQVKVAISQLKNREEGRKEVIPQLDDGKPQARNSEW